LSADPPNIFAVVTFAVPRKLSLMSLKSASASL